MLAPLTLEQALAEDDKLITFEAAAAKYGLSERDVKRLKGALWTADNASSLAGISAPIGSIEKGVVRDDERLTAFVSTHKSTGGRGE